MVFIDNIKQKNNLMSIAIRRGVGESFKVGGHRQKKILSRQIGHLQKESLMAKIYNI